MAIAIGHTTSADGTFSATGATEWNRSHSVTGLSSTSGALLYSTDATTLAQDGTNLLYTTSSGPRLQVGSSGTSTGLIFGYQGTSGFGAIWNSTVTPSSANMGLWISPTQTYLNGINNVFLAAGNTTKLAIAVTAGSGPDITAGTATTDVAALSVTRTNNNAAVATGVKFAFTDTTSAAGFLPFQVLGGAAGATNLLSLDKNGNIGTGGTVLTLNSANAAGALLASGSSGFQTTQIGGTSFNSNGLAAVRDQGIVVVRGGTGGYTWENGGNNPAGGTLDASIGRAGANSLVFGGATFSGGAATSRGEINKAVTAFTDGVAKTVFTLTIPNAAHSASYLVRLTGSIGAGGAIGANEASATNCYVVTLTRTAGVNATAAISSAFGAAATNVAGATTVTCTGALAAVSGGVGATNTIDIQATITKGGGSSDNHTCVATASLLNANSSGITIS